jgi:hypothetical protein
MKISVMLRPLYARGKSPCYPLTSRLDGLQGRSVRFGEVEHFLLQLEIEPGFLGPSRHSLVSLPTELFKLRHFDLRSAAVIRLVSGKCTLACR